ncbi:MAG TPA: glycosyltransferase [Polyangiaceae bacterium]
MRFVVFGFTVTASWCNGHATLWRALCRALSAMGHQVVFFERDAPSHAAHRDEPAPAGCDLHLYASWKDVLPAARRETARADAAIVTSYCPDAIAATDLVLAACLGTSVFYDLDTAVTLDGVEPRARAEYLPPSGLGAFDLVVSHTGGHALDALRERLGARRVAPLYACADPRVHKPAPLEARFASDLSYLGTYSADRRGAIDALFVEPARRRPRDRFVLGGAMYPEDFPRPTNLLLVPHVPPAEHPAFFSSAGLSLNVTRRAMARWGWCPPARLFEAAACGAPQVTDAWEGLEAFFEPGAEVLVAKSADDVLAALSRTRAEMQQLARRARERTLDEHTADARARTLVDLVTEE